MKHNKTLDFHNIVQVALNVRLETLLLYARFIREGCNSRGISIFSGQALYTSHTCIPVSDRKAVSIWYSQMFLMKNHFVEDAHVFAFLP